MNRFKLYSSALIGIAGINSLSCYSQNGENTQPNILLIVADDLGFSDTQPFGGEISTPNLERLADNGVRFTRFHTSSLSAPTRAMLLTGIDNHQCGLGNMPSGHGENQYMQPGYEGYLNDRSMTIAELLRKHDYYTCMAGKWHLGALKGYTPHDKGFQHSFALLAGALVIFPMFFPCRKESVPSLSTWRTGKK